MCAQGRHAAAVVVGPVGQPALDPAGVRHLQAVVGVAESLPVVALLAGESYSTVRWWIRETR